MDINELTQEQKDAILTHFRAAITHFRAAIASRVAQWEHEREIENILGEDTNLEIAYWAAGFDGGSSITWEDFLNSAS